MKRTSRLIAVAGLLCPLFAWGQGQVDTSGVGQVDNRVGGELYGKNSGQGMLILPQVRLLPSEERYAIIRSGALPSEVESGRIAAGPLTPNGVIDYVPRQSPLQRAMGLPGPQLYNPAYDPAVNNGRLNTRAQGGVTRGYPQTAQQGLAASSRRLGQRPQEADPRLLQQQRQQQQPGQRPQQEPQQPVDGLPRPAVRPPTDPIPGLTPAPEQPLPTGQLFDDVKYNPDSTEGAKFLNRQLPRILPPKPELRPSLAEEKKE